MLSIDAWPAQIDNRLVGRLCDAHVGRMLEFAPATEIRRFHAQRLGALIDHLRQHHPWWRARLAPFGPRVALTDLPILDRAAFIDSLALQAPPKAPPEHGALARNSSSGTSGQPLTFYGTALSQRVANSLYWDDHRRQGRRLDLECAALRGRLAAHPGQPHVQTPADRWMGDMHSFARLSSAFTIREHAQWLSDLAKARAGRLRYLVAQPTLLHGMLEEFAAAAVEAPKGIEQVMTLGESVSDDLRQLSRDTLGADIRDRYSCEETGPIAFQCPSSAQHYHAAEANVIVEIVDEAGQPCRPGQVGRVLVTHLHNYASATIRYDLGDLAQRMEACPCGIEATILGPLIGRQRALLRLPNGERKLLRVNSRDWIAVGGIREHRITQTAHDRVKVEVVPAGRIDGARIEAIRRMLASRLSEDLVYDIVVLDSIDWPAGKRQEVIGMP